MNRFAVAVTCVQLLSKNQFKNMCSFSAAKDTADRAWALRQKTLALDGSGADEFTNSFRWLNGVGDGAPAGLVADVFAGRYVAVCAAAPPCDEFQLALSELASEKGLVMLRTETSSPSLIEAGALAETTMNVVEHGIPFLVAFPREKHLLEARLARQMWSSALAYLSNQEGNADPIDVLDYNPQDLGFSRLALGHKGFAVTSMVQGRENAAMFQQWELARCLSFLYLQLRAIESQPVRHYRAIVCSFANGRSTLTSSRKSGQHRIAEDAAVASIRQCAARVAAGGLLQLVSIGVPAVQAERCVSRAIASVQRGHRIVQEVGPGADFVESPAKEEYFPFRSWLVHFE